MAYGQVADQAFQHVLVEHLADQTHVFMQPHLVAGIENGDTCRLLAAVLEGIEAEVGEVCHRLPRRQYGVDAAGLLWFIGPLIGGVRMHHQHGPIRDQRERSFCTRSPPIRRGMACS